MPTLPAASFFCSFLSFFVAASLDDFVKINRRELIATRVGRHVALQIHIVGDDVFLAQALTFGCFNSWQLLNFNLRHHWLRVCILRFSFR